MKNKHYDLIGDIHGHHDKLTALLARLGFKPHGNSHRHPEGRKVIFLGDYIDRGPKIREVLHTVRGMVEAGDALAIMGNHEFNAVAYHTADGKGGWLRERSEKNTRTHAATLAAFADRDAEWAEWVGWFKRLPMHLDLGALRAVHAAWDARHLAMLSGTPLLNDGFLHAAATKGTPEYFAVEIMLKGPEMELPDGVFFEDKERIKRKNVRVRWWDLKEGTAIGGLVMPDPMAELTETVAADMLRELPNYGADEPPVFFGHYWLRADREKAPLARNLASLDYSGAFGDNPLTAYRWDGEHELSSNNFVTSRHHE
jgi:hypothetical protein